VSIATSSAIGPALLTVEKRQRWFELFLVVSISLGLFLLNSVYLLKNSPAAPLSMTTLRSLHGIVHETLSLSLVGYVLSRRKLGLKSLGLGWSRRDVVPSFVVTVLAGLSYFAVALLLQLLHYELFGAITRGPSETILRKPFHCSITPLRTS